MPSTRQIPLFPEGDASRYAERTSGSFVGNMDAPVHRWFRYSAGFSGAWAEDLIAREAKQRELCVLDPFAGSATTLIAAEQCGVASWGCAGQAGVPLPAGPRASFSLADARSRNGVPASRFNLVVTSPPYPNNYDYADATRLELTFFGEVEGWGDIAGMTPLRLCLADALRRLLEKTHCRQPGRL